VMDSTSTPAADESAASEMDVPERPSIAPALQASSTGSPEVKELDMYLKGTGEALLDAIRSQACRASVDSVTSNMSAFSTTSHRHKEWEASIRTILRINSTASYQCTALQYLGFKGACTCF
jgi:hypothetical protein